MFKKKVGLISENEEFYRSLRRALTSLSGIEVNKSDIILQVEDVKYSIFLIYAEDRDILYKWLWNKLRLEHKFKSPVVAFGYHKLDSSADLRDKIFEDDWRSHQYFRIPFSLKELLESFNNLKPIGSLRKAIEKYADHRGLVKIAFHDLENTLGGGEEKDIKKEKACSLLSQLKEVLVAMGGNEQPIQEIDNIISRLKKSKMSDEECKEFKLFIMELKNKVII